MIKLKEFNLQKLFDSSDKILCCVPTPGLRVIHRSILQEAIKERAGGKGKRKEEDKEEVEEDKKDAKKQDSEKVEEQDKENVVEEQVQEKDGDEEQEKE